MADAKKADVVRVLGVNPLLLSFPDTRTLGQVKLDRFRRMV
jgi:hypothetical protein